MSRLRQLLVFCMLLIASKSFPQTSRFFDVAALHEDYSLFTKVLREAHPGLYRYTAEQEFQHMLDSVEKSLNKPMTDEQFYKLLMPIIVKIGCGHTKWFRNGHTDDPYAFYAANLFPFKMHFVDNRAWIVDSYKSENKSLIGSELISINGFKIHEIRRQINKYLPKDGNVRTVLNEELNKHFSAYFSTFVAHSEKYTIAVNRANKRINLTVPGVSADSIKKSYLASAGRSLAFKYIQPQTGLLTIRSFTQAPGETDFNMFIDSTFADLHERGIRNLIIDLRNNEGGEESFGGHLYSYLSDTEFVYYKKIKVARKEPFTFLKDAWIHPFFEQAQRDLVFSGGEYLWKGQPYLNKHQANANKFSGNIYVLINGLSFSVTSELASVIKGHNRAVFIGGETGGAYYGNNSGIFTIATLPNTKLGLGVPLASFYTEVKNFPLYDRGVLPDHEVKGTAEDVLQGRDPELELALKLIAR